MVCVYYVRSLIKKHALVNTYQSAGVIYRGQLVIETDPFLCGEVTPYLCNVPQPIGWMT